jgi:hypothetical protein
LELEKLSFDFAKLSLAQPDPWGNPLWFWVVFVLGTVVLAAFFRIARHLALRAARRIPAKESAQKWKLTLCEVLLATRTWFLFVFALYLCSHPMVFPKAFEKPFDVALKFLLFVQIGLWLDRGARALLRSSLPNETNTELNSVLVFLDNLGVNITALVTGLGVGGVAVALAVQNVLGDLFASLSIAWDKPFEVGDVICIAPHTGTVEKVGLKTTRIKLGTGEQLVIGNQELLKSRIQNFRRLEERRSTLSLHLSGATPEPKILHLRAALAHFLSGKKLVRVERAWVKNVGAVGVELECVYTILSPSYDEYSKIHQELCLKALSICQEQGISLESGASSQST